MIKISHTWKRWWKHRVSEFIKNGFDVFKKKLWYIFYSGRFSPNFRKVQLFIFYLTGGLSLLQTINKNKRLFYKNQYQVFHKHDNEVGKILWWLKTEMSGTLCSEFSSSLAIFNYSVETAVTTSKAVSSEVLM